MKTKIFAVMPILAVVASMLVAQAPKSNAEMGRIFAEDQKEREGFVNLSDAQLQQMSEHDAQRRNRVRQLLADGALQSGLDFRHAAFVFQHGDTPDDILMAHVLAMAAMSRGDADAKWIAAATLDRYLQRKDIPQVFGTQYGRKGGAEPHKWNQDPYDKDFIHDALRREFCVASYANQQLNVKALNDGKAPAAPDGCK